MRIKCKVMDSLLPSLRHNILPCYGVILGENELIVSMIKWWKNVAGIKSVIGFINGDYFYSIVWFESLIWANGNRVLFYKLCCLIGYLDLQQNIYTHQIVC